MFRAATWTAVRSIFQDYRGNKIGLTQAAEIVAGVLEKFATEVLCALRDAATVRLPTPKAKAEEKALSSAEPAGVILFMLSKMRGASDPRQAEFANALLGVSVAEGSAIAAEHTVPHAVKRALVEYLERYGIFESSLHMQDLIQALERWADYEAPKEYAFDIGGDTQTKVRFGDNLLQKFLGDFARWVLPELRRLSELKPVQGELL